MKKLICVVIGLTGLSVCAATQPSIQSFTQVAHLTKSPRMIYHPDVVIGPPRDVRHHFIATPHHYHRYYPQRTDYINKRLMRGMSGQYMRTHHSGVSEFEPPRKIDMPPLYHTQPIDYEVDDANFYDSDYGGYHQRRNRYELNPYDSKYFRRY